MARYEIGISGGTLAKYALIVLVIAIVVATLRTTMETFVPIVPSPEQDRKYVTPAGNVITY